MCDGLCVKSKEERVSSPVRLPWWAEELLDKDGGAVDCGLENLAWCLFLGITTGNDGGPDLVSAAPVKGCFVRVVRPLFLQVVAAPSVLSFCLDFQCLSREKSREQADRHTVRKQRR